MAVDPEEEVTVESAVSEVDKVPSNAFGSTEDLLSSAIRLDLARAGAAGMVNDLAVDLLGGRESREEADKKQQRREAATLAALALSRILQEELEELANDTWTFLMANYTPQQILDMTTDKLDKIIKDEFQARLNELSKKIAEEKGISPEEAEKLALEIMREEIIAKAQAAQAELEQRITTSYSGIINGTLALQLAKEGDLESASTIGGLYGKTPQEAMDYLQAQIEANAQYYKDIVDALDALDELQTAMTAAHGEPDAEIDARIASLEAALEMQGNLTTLNVEIKAFIEENATNFETMSATEILQAGFANKNLMAAFTDVHGDDPQKWVDAFSQIAQQAGIPQEKILRYLEAQQQFQTAKTTAEEFSQTGVTGGIDAIAQKILDENVEEKAAVAAETLETLEMKPDRIADLFAQRKPEIEALLNDPTFKHGIPEADLIRELEQRGISPLDAKQMVALIEQIPGANIAPKMDTPVISQTDRAPSVREPNANPLNVRFAQATEMTAPQIEPLAPKSAPDLSFNHSA